MKLGANFCCYSSDIPLFLQERPRDFVVHCLQKLEISKNMDVTGIVQTGIGEFKVIDYNNGKETYNICFGDSENIPRCSCHDWNRTGMFFFLHFCEFVQNFFKAAQKLKPHKNYST